MSFQRWLDSTSISQCPSYLYFKCVRNSSFLPLLFCQSPSLEPMGSIPYTGSTIVFYTGDGPCRSTTTRLTSPYEIQSRTRFHRAGSAGIPLLFRLSIWRGCGSWGPQVLYGMLLDFKMPPHCIFHPGNVHRDEIPFPWVHLRSVGKEQQKVSCTGRCAFVLVESSGRLSNF